MKSNKVYFLIGICFILLAVGSVFVSMENLENKEIKLNAKLDNMIEQKEKAQEELDIARNKYRDQIAAAALQETGAHSDSMIRDMKYLADVIKPMYNWQSSAEYTKARDTIVEQIGEYSIYAVDVIPPLVTKDVSGKDMRYSLDEDDLNMKCMMVDIFPAKEVKGKSAYYAIVEYIQYYGNDIEKQDHLTRQRQILYIVMDSADKIKSIDASNTEDIRKYDTGNNG